MNTTPEVSAQQNSREDVSGPVIQNIATGDKENGGNKGAEDADMTFRAALDRNRKQLVENVKVNKHPAPAEIIRQDVASTDDGSFACGVCIASDLQSTVSQLDL